MKIRIIQSLWPEPKDFFIHRRDTGDEYIFIHYLTPVKIFLNEKWQTAPAGSCILYDKHSYQHFISEQGELLHNWCHVQGNLNNIVLNYHFQYNTLYYPSDNILITKLFQSLEAEVLSEKVLQQEMITLKFQELLIAILQNCDQSTKEYLPHTLQKNFLELRNRIKRTYNQPWSVPKMARELNFSEAQFYKLYQRMFGISPKQDLLQIRMDHAILLLSQKNYTVREISELTGYSNPYHFIRQFKKRTGITPGKYNTSLNDTAQ